MFSGGPHVLAGFSGGDKERGLLIIDLLCVLGPVSSSPLLSRWQPEQERTPWLMVVSINPPTIDLPGLQKKN